jgi:AcrR family transcriptional regulator
MPRAGLNREVVVDAAARILDREGLNAVTPARLGETLGVKPPSLYKHVDGIDDVRRGLALRGLREAEGRLRDAMGSKSGEEALLSLARAYRRFAKDRPGLYAASLRAARPGERDIASAGEAVMGIVLGAIGGYGVKGNDALHAVRGFRAIIHGFVALDAAGGFRLGLDLDESLARLIRAFARDLETRAA